MIFIGTKHIKHYMKHSFKLQKSQKQAPERLYQSGHYWHKSSAKKSQSTHSTQHAHSTTEINNILANTCCRRSHKHQDNDNTTIVQLKRQWQSVIQALKKPHKSQKSKEQTQPPNLQMILKETDYVKHDKQHSLGSYCSTENTAKNSFWHRANHCQIQNATFSIVTLLTPCHYHTLPINRQTDNVLYTKIIQQDLVQRATEWER